MNPIPINLATEDVLSELTLRKVLASSLRTFEVRDSFGQRGAGYLKAKIAGFNSAAKFTPYLVLTDLDNTECAPSLIREWLTTQVHPNFLFSVAVREVESWLLADRRAFAAFLGIAETLISRAPDSLLDPKREVIQLAKRSRHRHLREAIVPAPNTSARIGPDYNGTLGRFVLESWEPNAAMENSDSLRRMINRLAKFTPT